MWTVNFQMFKLVLEKAEEQEIKLPTSVRSLKKQDISRKHLLLLYWLCQSLWLCGSQETVENSETDGNIKSPDLPPETSVCRSRRIGHGHGTGHGITDWFQTGKEYIKTIYCHPAYLIYMQNTSCKMPVWMKHKLESRLLGEISITSDMQMTPPLWHHLLDESEKGEWKSWLKSQHSYTPWNITQPLKRIHLNQF